MMMMMMVIMVMASNSIHLLSFLIYIRSSILQSQPRLYNQ